MEKKKRAAKAPKRPGTRCEHAMCARDNPTFRDASARNKHERSRLAHAACHVDNCKVCPTIKTWLGTKTENELVYQCEHTSVVGGVRCKCKFSTTKSRNEHQRTDHAKCNKP